MTGNVPTTKAQGFSISPDDDRVKLLGELGKWQDQIGDLVRHLNIFERMPPLGGGYATEIAQFMTKLATGDPEKTPKIADESLIGGDINSAKDALIAAGKKLERHRSKLDKALKLYEASEKRAKKRVEGVDCIGGG